VAYGKNLQWEKFKYLVWTALAGRVNMYINDIGSNLPVVSRTPAVPIQVANLPPVQVANLPPVSLIPVASLPPVVHLDFRMPPGISIKSKMT
jgi:hypothetical protein